MYEFTPTAAEPPKTNDSATITIDRTLMEHLSPAL